MELSLSQRTTLDHDEVAVGPPLLQWAVFPVPHPLHKLVEWLRGVLTRTAAEKYPPEKEWRPVHRLLEPQEVQLTEL